MQSESFFAVCGLPFFPQNDDMTLQVGMLSHEGIVIVGDTWQYVESSVQGRLRHGYHATKIRMSESSRIAVSCARNMDMASRVAESIFEKLSGPCPDRRRAILDIAASTVRGHDVECMAIFADPHPSLFGLTCGTKEGEWLSRCEEISSGWPSGDVGNPAYYWAMRYYNYGLSLRHLAKIGAMVNVSAEKFNSGTIGGLEVIVCDKDGIRKWTKEESNALRDEAQKMTNQIGDMITA